MTVREWFSHSLMRLSHFREQLIQLFRRHIMMEIVIELNCRRPTAGAHALHFLERKLPVRRHFLVPDAKRLRSVLVQVVSAQNQTADVGAYLDVALAERLA